MAQEQGIAKVDLSYIYKAVMMGNSLYSDNWEKGVLYLTNLNLWFSEGGGWLTIPLKSVSMVGREVSDPIRVKAQRTIGTSHILMIDYLQQSSVVEGATAPATALLAGNEAVINTLKAYLQPMCGTPPKKQSLSDVDKKLLYMLYTGVNDLQKLTFFIGVDNDTLAASFKNLREANMCDTSGKLTEQGQKQIKEMM
jgi:helix-turn-helix protein